MRQSNLGLEIDGPWTRFHCKHFSSQHSSTTPATENKGKARTKRLKADSIQIHSVSFHSIQPCTGIAQVRHGKNINLWLCVLKPCVIFTLILLMPLIQPIRKPGWFSLQNIEAHYFSPPPLLHFPLPQSLPLSGAFSIPARGMLLKCKANQLS